MSTFFPIENLSTEILLMIFGNLSIPDLKNLMDVCDRFKEIIEHHWDIIIYKRRIKYLVTNQDSKYILDRCRRKLLPYDKHRISNNWRIGRYSEDQIYLSKIFIPYFHLERNWIWYGHGDNIKCYERFGDIIDRQRVKYHFRGFENETCKFVVKNNILSAANGTFVRTFPLNKKDTPCNISLDPLRLTSIDMDSNLIAAGSKEGVVQILSLSEKLVLAPCKKMEYKDLIWSLALKDNKLAVGTATNNAYTCMIVVDPESGRTIQEFSSDKKGAGVLHIKWDNPNILWSGGYDCHLRRWDVRTGECVQKFMDPYASTINCFDYDFVNTIITGCNDSRATLWDIRRDSFVQIYFMESATFSWSKSPIHCLAFDAEYLFAATDTYMNMLDFSVKRGTSHDYSEIFVKQIVIN